MEQQKNEINILQWNARSLYNKKGELENIIAKLELHVVIISETWLKPDTMINMSGFITYRTERADNYGGLLIWIHHTIPVTTTYKSKPEEKLQYITINTADISITGTYAPPNYGYKEDEIETIIQYSTNQKKIIAGDFNIYKFNIESYSTTRKTHKIIKIMEKYDLICINNNTPTRIGYQHQNNTSPDLSFISSNMLNDYSWEMPSDTMGSDHLPILPKIQSDNIHENQSSRYHRQNISNFNPTKYKQFLEEYLVQDVSKEVTIQYPKLTVRNKEVQYLNAKHPRIPVTLKIKKKKLHGGIQNATK